MDEHQVLSVCVAPCARRVEMFPCRLSPQYWPCEDCESPWACGARSTGSERRTVNGERVRQRRTHAIPWFLSSSSSLSPLAVKAEQHRRFKKEKRGKSIRAQVLFARLPPRCLSRAANAWPPRRLAGLTATQEKKRYKKSKNGWKASMAPRPPAHPPQSCVLCPPVRALQFLGDDTSLLQSSRRLRSWRNCAGSREADSERSRTTVHVRYYCLSTIHRPSRPKVRLPYLYIPFRLAYQKKIGIFIFYKTKKSVFFLPFIHRTGLFIYPLSFISQ